MSLRSSTIPSWRRSGPQRSLCWSDRVHVAGGGITDPGDFYPFNRSFIEDEIENYGLAPESVRLDEIPLAESKRRAR
jgi:hypothetical protein